MINILISLLPAILIITIFVYSRKHKGRKLRDLNRFGRKGKKDHSWLILKDYHKSLGIQGVSIVESFVFDRPDSKDLVGALKRGKIFLEKQNAKKKGIKYVKPKFDFKEDLLYFEKLEKETAIRNKDKLSFSRRAFHSSKRRRFVILYKTKHSDIVSNWKAIEVELTHFKEKGLQSVLVNGELDVYKELLWLAPRLHEKIEARRPKKEIEFIKQLKEKFKRKKKTK